MKETDDFEKEYSEESFWNKLAQYAKIAGKEIVEKALWLFYAAQKPDTPVWAKAIIYSTLGYFILPMDAIPDIIPVVGYADDLGAFVVALGIVAAYIDKNVKQQAREKMKDWFDDPDEGYDQVPK